MKARQTLLEENQDLKERLSYYQAIFEATPDAMLISDGQGKITMANQQAERLLGYTVNELVGMSIEDLVPKSSRKIHAKLRTQFTATSSSRTMGEGRGVKVLCKNGIELDVEISLSPIKTPQGLFFASAIRDISERLRTQQILRDKEQMLSDAEYIGQLGSWALDIATGCLIWSDQVYRLFEVDSAQFAPSYTNFLAVVHPEDREVVSQAYADSLITKQPYEITHRLLMPDGRIKWVHEKCTTDFDDQGKPIRSKGMVQDVTDTKKTQERLQLADMVYEYSIEGIVVTDAENRIISVNPAFTEITGYTQAEVLGKSPNIFKSGVQDNHFYRDMWQQLNTKGVWQGEIWDKRKDDKIHAKFLSIRVIHNPEGLIHRYLAIFSDITARKQYEEEIKRLSDTELNKAKLEAERASQAKSDFLSSMSHELRTPMNAVLGFAQLLELEDLSEDQSDSVEQILTAGRHLLDLINQVLDLSTIEAEKVEIKLETIDLNSVLQNCISLTKPLQAKYQVEIINKTEPCLCMVIADALHLKQVLVNLISNAIKYNRKNGTVTIFCESISTQAVKINVADTGNGLSEEQLKKLFQPFERLSAKNSSVEGSGVGLVITKKLIEAMHGKIGVSSIVKEGSCFWIEIPLGITE
jgi:PAS domain S-box-containing protein